MLSPMPKFKKHFSVDEANALITELKPIMQKIRDFTLILKEQGFDVYRGKYFPAFHPDTLDEFPPVYRKMIKMMHTVYIKGIEIKGLEQGLLDFPALRNNGEEVYLCWKLDEEEIGFWHPLEGGFAGRKSIEDF